MHTKLEHYIGQYVGYRWCYWLGAICTGAMLVLMFFCFPETLYRDRSRPEQHQASDASFSAVLKKKLKLWGHKSPKHNLRAIDFIRPLQMLAFQLHRSIASRLTTLSMSRLAYPSVAFPVAYYSVAFAFASIEPAVTVASIFNANYKFNARHATVISSYLG